MASIDALNSALRNICRYQGRSTKAEFWWFMFFWRPVLGGLAIFLSIYINDHAFEWIVVEEFYKFLLGLLLCIFVIFPSYTLTIRRLHDANRSGYWLLLWLLLWCLPPLGIICEVVIGRLQPTEGWNRFGPDPRSINELLYKAHIERLDRQH